MKGMGEIRVQVGLANDGDLALRLARQPRRGRVRRAEVEAVVDTGAVMTLLPPDLVDRLGLRRLDRRRVILADERVVEFDRAGTISLTVARREMKTDCLVGPPGCEPLLGQLVLEALDLVVDARRRTVTPRPESPDMPTLKLKAARNTSPPPRGSEVS